MHENLPGSYVDIILDACLHAKAHDRQIEGSRAEYMLDIVRRTGDPSFYKNRVVDALSAEADEWDALQRFQMATLLAQEGDQRARHAIEVAFERQIGSSMEDAFAEEFIRLDGIAGLLFAAGRIGSRLIVDRERWADDYLLSTAEDTYGREPVWDALRDLAKTDENISAYMDAVNANRWLCQECPRPDPSTLRYEQIRAMIASGKPEGVLADWGMIADSTELELAAWDLIHELDSTRLRSYLLIFRKRAFPLGSDHLLQLLGMAAGPVPRHALTALGNLQDDKVRRLALSLVEAGSPLRGYSVSLLTNNFRPGDHELVKAWCDAEQDAQILNDFDRSLAKFFNAQPNDSMESQILRMLYDREPCSHCRCFIVERLLQLNSLPDDLRAESEHDSYLKTRALVRLQ